MKYRGIIVEEFHQSETKLKPLVVNVPFLYSVKTSENLTVFCCFQGQRKVALETNGLILEFLIQFLETCQQCYYHNEFPIIFLEFHFHATGDDEYIIFFLYPRPPLDTGHKLSIDKTCRKHPGCLCLLNILCTFNLCPVSRGSPGSLRSLLMQL